MANLLTPKQEAFAQEYVKNGGNATAAYKLVYIVTSMARATLNASASRLLAHVMVAPRIIAIRERAAHRVDVTQDSIVQGLHDIASDTALSPGHRVPAYMGMAKILGFIVDKKELTGTIEHLLPKRSDMSIEELREGIAALKALEAGSVEGEYQEA